ncbi:MAG: hypothetical protein K2X54_20510 [Methylobacterium organophilum]|nr:hypothetical protein [Methylobacterium organophilum]
MPQPGSHFTTSSRIAIAMLRPVNDDEPVQTSARDEDFRNRFAACPDAWIPEAQALDGSFHRFTRRDRVWDGYIAVDRMLRQWRFEHTLTRQAHDRLVENIDAYGAVGAYVLTTRVEPGLKVHDRLWIVRVL